MNEERVTFTLAIATRGDSLHHYRGSDRLFKKSYLLLILHEGFRAGGSIQLRWVSLWTLRYAWQLGTLS